MGVGQVRRRRGGGSGERRTRPSACLPAGPAGSLCSLAAKRENMGDELPGQLGGALADVEITGPVGEFVEPAEGLINIPEAMLGQDSFPLRFRALEMLREWPRRFRGFDLNEGLVNVAHATEMLFERGVELVPV